MRKSILFVLVFLLSSHLSFSQDEPEKAKTDTTRQILAIPVAEISIRSEKVRNDISVILEQSQLTEEMLAIIKLMPIMSDSIRLEKKAFEKEEPENWTKRRLENDELGWVNIKRDLSEWRSLILESTTKLADSKIELDQVNKVWEATRKSAIDSEVPKVTMDKIALILREEKKAQKVLSDLSANYLVMQDKTADLINIVNEVLKEFDNLKQEFAKAYWALDADPIWRTPIFLSEKEVETSLSISLESDMKVFLEFLQIKIFAVIFYLILFSLLMALIAYYRKQDIKHITSESEEIYIKVVKAILERPVSSSLLILLFVMVLSGLKMPTIWMEIITVLIMIPLVRLMQGFVNPRIWKYFLFLIVLFVLVRVDSYLADGLYLNRRYLQLIEAVFSVYIFSSLYLRRKFLITSSIIKSRRLFVSLIPVGGILSLFSLVGNLIGMTIMAENMLIGTVNSAVYLLMLYTIYLIINGFISILIRRQQVQAFQTLKKRTRQVERHIMTIFRIILSLLWIRSVLRAFSIYEPVQEAIIDFIYYDWSIGTFSISVDNILGFIIAISVTFYITRLISLILEEDVFARIKFPRGVSGTISMISRYIIVGIGTVVALAIAGFDLSKISLIVGALGVGIGFGLQNIINNFVSGLILAFERPIQAGDVIQVGVNLGTVRQIGVRSSRIRSFDGTEVIVPNADLISKEVTNWTLSDKLKRQELFIKVAIDSNPHLVKDILEKVCLDHAYVLDDPRPLILYLGFSELSLDFRMLFWSYADNGLTTKSEVGLKVYDELSKAGIRVPVQLREVNIREKKNHVSKKTIKSRPTATD